MKRRLLFLFLLPALLTAPLLAVPEPTANELTANRVRLGKWQRQPEQMARLRRDAKAFLSLPPARQEQVLQLDYDLNQETVPTRDRMLDVLERYSEWLDRLSETDRQAIASASKKTRLLTVIRALRDKEWMDSQPRSVRDQWTKLAGKDQAEFLRKARLEERQRREEWLSVRRFWNELERNTWRPVRLADLDNRDREGVQEYLMPMLSGEEKLLLTGAEGNWPAYPLTLVELADLHPLALPGKHGPRTFNDLPEALKSRFNTKIPTPFGETSHASVLKPDEGSWPKFGTAAAKLNKHYMNTTPLPRELWAYDYKSLLGPMQKYLTKVLKPALSTSKEEQELANAEGHWPKYPEKIQELVRSHALPTPPWATALSGSAKPWDGYRMVQKDTAPPATATPVGKRHD